MKIKIQEAETGVWASGAGPERREEAVMGSCDGEPGARRKEGLCLQSAPLLHTRRTVGTKARRGGQH